MSIRNLDADLAANKLNELFHLHRYEDCVLFINRLNNVTIKLVCSQISIDMYMSRLPYTIEIFEAIYAKIFIMDPDNFPTRTLKPERLIDKMIAYFSLLSDQSKMEPIDGAKLLDSFENCIRIISYVQPNLYSRLLYFKYAIDKSLLKLEKDFAMFSHLNNTAHGTLNHDYQTINSIMKSNNALTNALVVSRASNMQSCDSMEQELTQTMNNCEKALNKLHEYISNLKSQKLFRDVQLFLNAQQTQKATPGVVTSSSSKTPAKKIPGKRSTSCNKDPKPTGSPNGTAETSETNLNRNKSGSVRLNSNGHIEPTTFVYSSTICQDFIQNRLYLNKAMMNSIEPFLQTIKLQQLMANLYEKIESDKEILLVFTHLKREEIYLSSLEPLQPLFRRYSLGFERCIQIWRRKCSADSLLLFNDNLKPLLDQSTPNLYRVPPNQLYIINNEESAQIDRLQSSYDAASSPHLTRSQQEAVASVTMSPTQTTTEYLSKDDSLKPSTPSKQQKYHSELNLFTNQKLSGYMTLPAKLKRPQFDEKNSFIPDNGLLDKEDLAKDADRKSDYSSVNGRKASQSSNGCKSVRTAADVENMENSYEREFLELEKMKLAKSNETLTLALAEQQSLTDKYKQELNVLHQELESARDAISKLRRNESKLKEKIEQQEKAIEEAEKAAKSRNVSQTSAPNSLELSIQNDSALLSSTTPVSLTQLSGEIVKLYTNLNMQYRMEAYESLDSLKEIQNMNEFKLKLLFSVIVLSYRYVKLFIRDLKRKIKILLQITERSGSNERNGSMKSQAMTPTIIVQKPDDEFRRSEKIVERDEMTGGGDRADRDSNERSPQPSQRIFRFSSQISNETPRRYLDYENSGKMIENSLNRYLQIAAATNAFDISKIVEDVKEQLWTTLYDYPLKECQELNSYITESVKTCWSLVNHQPPFKLDYTSTKYEPSCHVRYSDSNLKNDTIVQYVWPSLIDTSDNSCLVQGIVIT